MAIFDSTDTDKWKRVNIIALFYLSLKIKEVSVKLKDFDAAIVFRIIFFTPSKYFWVMRKLFICFSVSTA